MRNCRPFLYDKSKGSALITILIILGLAIALLVSALKSNPQIERDKTTADALTKAKDALVGYAVTYRENNATHADDVWGYLPCPNWPSSILPEGSETGTCAATNFNVLGRLPWYTLGLPPLRDSAAECLWYAVSGRFKGGSTRTTPLNWDTAGQIDVMSEDGSTIQVSNVVAVIFAPGALLPSQNRSSVIGTPTPSCGGNYDARNYLDPYDSGSAIASVINYFPGSSNNLTAPDTTNKKFIQPTTSDYYNDRLLTITADDIFNKVRQRSDFKTAVDALISDFAACLNAMASPPVASTGNKGMNNALVSCPAPTNAAKAKFYNNWKDNLLYAKPGGSVTVNASTCDAVLIFGGARTASQVRITAADKSDDANYLEGSNATAFPSGNTYSGANAYNKASPSNDIVACITGITGIAGPTQVTFASNFASFTTAGTGVTTNTATHTLSLASVGTSSGGCFWYPTAIPLNGKTLRAYYNFAFSNPDPAGGTDLGNGITISFLRGDVGAPTACGAQTSMGVLNASTLWGGLSFFVETDIRETSANNDPAGNHTAIMANGNLVHSATSGGNGYTTTACNGTAQGCLHSPASKFEESPAPLTHNQRIEIHTGYSDNSCTTTGGSYAKIQAWVDCTSCNDTSTDFAATATVIRCALLDPALNTFYFGLTGGLSSGGGGQGVTFQNFDLLTQ